jgi:lysophospholipase L1-like esterase
MRLTRAIVLFVMIFSPIGFRPASGVAAPAVTAAPAATTTTPAAAATTRPHNFARWEKQIAAMEAADRTNPPPKGGVLFIGSSTIRGWRTLAQDYPDHQVVNRGFGGSQIVDSTHFADRLIFPHEPRMVLMRAGGNDIHAGKSAGEVFRDFQAFVAKVHSKLPETEVVFIGLAPAPVRWSERDENKKLNALVEEWVKTTPRVKYVETYDTTVTPDGQAREELFVKDRLHFNAEGYKLLAERVRTVLPPPKS